MITKIKLINIFIISHSYLCVCLVRHICPLDLCMTIFLQSYHFWYVIVPITMDSPITVHSCFTQD